MRALLGACLVALLSACAANSVTTLLKASGQRDGVVPSGTVVQGELRGRAFEVGSVDFNVREPADKQGPDIPDGAYLRLFDTQLRKAFAGAGLDIGALPARHVDVAIEKLKLMPAKFLIGQRSLLRVRMEIAPLGGPVLMRGQFESFVAPPTVMIMSSGYVVPIVLPSEGQEYVALSKLFPAVAVVIAATTQGLQQGKTLDEIRIYPKDIEAGTTIGPDLFLEQAPFGMTEMNWKEMRRVISEAKVRGEQ
jgi:hypothetical protein